MSGRPLMTLVVLGYNQASLIRSAIEGALAQVYSPLEIILSDDCSSDNTFSIMKELAETYSGPHRVYINRNPYNYRMAGHLNRVMEMARGELIGVAAGDDISLPERMEVTYREWERGGRRAFSVHARMHVINEWASICGIKDQPFTVSPGPASQLQLKNMIETFKYVTGASNTFHRSVYDVFGPLDLRIINEDISIAFRAALLGDIIYIPQAIALYRKHPGGISQRRRTMREEAQFWAESRIPICSQYRNDLRTMGSNDAVLYEAINMMDRKVNYMASIFRENFLNRLGCVQKALFDRVPPSWIIKQLMKSMIFH